jgi:uncharacterized protein (TIGR03382 family)
MRAVFFQIPKALGSFGGPAAWAAPFLVLAALVRRRRWASVLLAVVAFAVPLAFASPVVAIALERCAAQSVRSTMKEDVVYDVVIVLSGKAEERLGPAADLIRTGRARLLLYSGRYDSNEAQVVASTLRSHHIRDDEVLFEQNSQNTHENAVESARIVTAQGWKRIVLVTGAIHERRALACFRKVGLFPDLLPIVRRRPDGLLPRFWALDASTAALHESLGLVAYRVAGYVD